MDEKEKIEELLTRGVDEVIIKEHLEERLKSGKKLRVKFGIDPTSSNLHLGHSVPLRKLKQFQDLGHQVILLIGDYTATIGDPSGRSEARKMLSRADVRENMKDYQAQAAKILDIDKVEIRYNSEWYDKFGASFLFEITSKFTVAKMLEREDFQRRIKEDVDVSIMEVIYPLMQGYDSVELNADIELGGTDQKLNLLMGRKVQRRYDKPEQDIITVPILEGLDGVNKMSKSLNNYIGLSEDSSGMFGKIMSIPDGVMRKYFRLLTDVSEEEIEKMKDVIRENKLNPKDVKIRLAKEIVSMYHGTEEAEKAAGVWESTFSKGEFPEDALIVEGDKDARLADVLVEKGIVDSKTEFRRLVEAGAVSEYPDIKIIDPNETIQKDRKIKIGKKIFIQTKTA